MSLRSKRASLIHRAASLPTGSSERRALLARLKSGASLSWLGQQMKSSLETLRNDLKAKAGRYVGDPSAVMAKVETGRGLKSAHGVTFTVWLPLDEGDGRAEAQELADLLLGAGAAVGTHTLVGNMWVATQTIDLH